MTDVTPQIYTRGGIWQKTDSENQSVFCQFTSFQESWYDIK